jgi:hypothetical protein
MALLCGNRQLRRINLISSRSVLTPLLTLSMNLMMEKSTKDHILENHAERVHIPEFFFSKNNAFGVGNMDALILECD